MLPTRIKVDNNEFILMIRSALVTLPRTTDILHVYVKAVTKASSQIPMKEYHKDMAGDIKNS